LRSVAGAGIIEANQRRNGKPALSGDEPIPLPALEIELCAFHSDVYYTLSHGVSSARRAAAPLSPTAPRAFALGDTPSRGNRCRVDADIVEHADVVQLSPAVVCVSRSNRAYALGRTRKSMPGRADSTGRQFLSWSPLRSVSPALFI